MSGQRIFFSIVLGSAAISTVGLAVLYVAVQPQLAELRAYEGAERPLLIPLSECMDIPESYDCKLWYGSKSEQWEQQRRAKRNVLRANFTAYWHGGGYVDHTHHWQRASPFLQITGRLVFRLLALSDDSHFWYSTLESDVDRPELISNYEPFLPGIRWGVLFLGLAASAELIILSRRLMRKWWVSDRDGHDPKYDDGPSYCGDTSRVYHDPDHHCGYE